MEFYKVVIIESERGWGQRVDEIRYFKDKEEARNYVSQQNALNTESQAPDIYWRAEDPQTIEVPDEVVKWIVEDAMKKQRAKARKKRAKTRT